MVKKEVVGVILFFLISLSIIFIIVYKDTIFESKTTLQYSDGCIEHYTNGDLISSECINARNQLRKRIEAQEQYPFFVPTNITNG